MGPALQGTLSNVAAGVMLLILRPFRVGQFVEISNHQGAVREIGLFTTILVTRDMTYVSIPNSAVFGGHDHQLYPRAAPPRRLHGAGGYRQ